MPKPVYAAAHTAVHTKVSKKFSIEGNRRFFASLPHIIKNLMFSESMENIHFQQTCSSFIWWPRLNYKNIFALSTYNIRFWGTEPFFEVSDKPHIQLILDKPTTYVFVYRNIRLKHTSDENQQINHLHLGSHSNHSSTAKTSWWIKKKAKSKMKEARSSLHLLLKLQTRITHMSLASLNSQCIIEGCWSGG